MTLCAASPPKARTWKKSATAHTPARISIRAAANQEEFEQLYRFRYAIYVEEMGRKQKYADHQAKRIEDPLDCFGTNLIAWDHDASIAGVVRIHVTET